MNRTSIRALLAALSAVSLCYSAVAQNRPPQTEEQILRERKEFSFAPEFNATVFASPPNVSYPIFVSVGPDGTAFVGCDPNSSLDRITNRGRVVMCRDTNGDGKADLFTDFAKMDSPRGVAWDQSTRTLYVMHPPNLTAYHDDNNTGVANREEDLIKGLGFDLGFRGADHTINGIRIGIDGWIYVACGDYGAVKATGKDGRSIAMRGGGIVRIRPDGTGLEQVVWGTRNILAVAISPTMELFTRDNTNDGDDWNDRLSFNPFGAQMGYPTLFRNFSDEIIPTMIDFGGGSPVGSIFIDEPNLPSKWAHGFYSVEWGRNEVDLHPLTRSGATWKAETINFMKMPHATDMDVDGSGHLYVTSLEGATFNYAGPSVGYVIRLTPKGTTPAAVPDFKRLTDAQLVANVGSASGVWRQAAQRELLVRGAKSTVTRGLQQIVSKGTNIGARVAAIYTLKQLQGVKSHPALTGFLKNDELREYVLKAMADDTSVASQVSAKPYVQALSDKNPRVRLQAVTGLGHLGKIEAAKAMLALTADPDYTVAHIAVQELRFLKASEVCLKALDSQETQLQPGALRVLQAIYDPAVVDGLLRRLSTSNSDLRRGIYNTLCRLDKKEAVYTDPKMWWGTRPDTSGPIFKPESWEMTDQIEAALRQQLTVAQGEDAKAFVATLLRTKISFPGFSDLMLAKTGRDSASLLDAITAIISPKTPTPDDIVKALSNIASGTAETPELRTRALRLLLPLVDKNYGAVRDAFLSVASVNTEGPLVTVRNEFTRDARLGTHVSDFARLAQDADPARRLFADTVLVNLATTTAVQPQRGQRAGRGGGANSKQLATDAIDNLWKNPEQTVSLLNVIALDRATQFGPQVREQATNSNLLVADTAKMTLAKLGLDKTATPGKNIADLSYEEAARLTLASKGDAKIGEQLFTRQGCILCHTISPKDPPKGPMLGGITTRYSRADLIESILKPSAKIAQGFETQSFKLKNGDDLDGFVAKELGDSVEVRNGGGLLSVIEKGDIVERKKKDQSIMPEGLAANLTPDDLASILAYLESTAVK